MLRKIFRRSENTTLLALALAVGLTTGIGVWLFRTGIEVFYDIFDVRLAQDMLGGVLGVWAIIPALALAGFIVGWMMDRFVGPEPYHGLAGIIESVALTGGRIRYAVMPIKALASALSLGAGASVGPESPTVIIGASIGSFLSQRLRLPEERSRLLVAAGSAAAIAAVFRAPISGVFFALEVILNSEFNTGSFSVVVLAAVIGSAFLQAVEGGTPEFGVLNFTFSSPFELVYYALLGVLLAPVSVGFIRAVEWQHKFWHHRIHLARRWKAALTGILIGIVGVFLPQIMGTGREAMTSVLQGEHFDLWLLLALSGAKLLMTAVSLGGGFVGGVFAPTLFIGSMFGAAFGQIVTGGSAAGHEAFAIAGMAAVMAGVVRAPITGILLAFELTNDYHLVMPIMFTTVICVYITERLVPGGLDELALMGAGVHLQQGRDVDVMQGITVGEVMETPAPTILTTASLTELRDCLREKRSRALCVLDADESLYGIVTLTDLQQAYDSPDGSKPPQVKDICTHGNITTVLSKDPLWVAIRSMGTHHVGQLPVLEERTSKLLGLVTRSDVMDAYQTAIARKMKTQERVQRIRLNALTGAKIIELHVASNATIVSKRIRDVEWPKESVIASVRRDDKLILPHGDTQIQAWDTLTFVAEPGVEDQLAVLCGYEVAAHKNGKH